MDNQTLYVLARVVHVLGVVLWIGGVAFVTTILLPALRKTSDAESRLVQFDKLEGRFARQARFVTLLTGLSGLYLLYVLNAWERYLYPEFWWMHLMTFVWLVFTLVLFILEPLFLHRFFVSRAQKNSDLSFAWAQNLHRVLLALSLVAVAGATAGAHGYMF